MTDPPPKSPGNPPELVLFVGVQGSGKTSFYRERFSGTHVHVSKDLFPNNRNKARRQRQLIEEALSSGRSVVLDNTNPTWEDRAGAITLARAYRATVTGYVFVTDIQTALERNRGREGKARVPDVAIYATAKRLQHPSPEEGFGTLFAVRLTPAGEFEISPWRTP
ncbi:AAA family ATPase [Deinococcus apachensis]|uniref:AAA family ATPase n=1 Tax=Deinococcus apachensis TaxID=309886 RepID=UPI00036CD3B5|nr:AAA family ATPase [Deinococcus apachensis]